MPSLRMAALLVGVWIVAVAATSFPASVDMNLVFPRNSTYDANTLLPIVFAFSNPALLTPLQVLLSYELYNTNNLSQGWFNILVQPTTQFHLDTNGTTYLAVGAMPELFNKVGTWLLTWTLETVNCSTTDAGVIGAGIFRYTGVGYSGSGASRWASFSTTTGSGGAQPDVAAAAANMTCGTQIATGDGPVIIQVASTLNISEAKPFFPDNDFYGDTCAVLPSPSPSPTVPVSCAVSLDAGAIASVSAVATRIACSSLHPLIPCPPPTPSSAASSLRPIVVSSFLPRFPAVGSATGMALAMVAAHFWGGLF